LVKITVDNRREKGRVSQAALNYSVDLWLKFVSQHILVGAFWPLGRAVVVVGCAAVVSIEGGIAIGAKQESVIGETGLVLAPFLVYRAPPFLQIGLDITELFIT